MTGPKAGTLKHDEIAIAWQRCRKNVSAAMNKHARIEKLLETMFSHWSVPRLLLEAATKQ
jgi:hypothetical protein